MKAKNLIVGVSSAIFAAAILAAGYYAATQLRPNANVQSSPPLAREVAPAQSAAMPAAAAGGKVDSVEVMVERLRARLEAQPNDVDGWVLLGRSYHFLERWDEAKAAFARARELGYQGDSDNAAAMPAANGATEHGATGEAAPVFNDIGRVGQDGRATAE